MNTGLAAAGAVIRVGANTPILQLTSLAPLVAELSNHCELAQAFATASSDKRATISAIFDGLNAYLGNYIGASGSPCSGLGCCADILERINRRKRKSRSLSP